MSYKIVVSAWANFEVTFKGNSIKGMVLDVFEGFFDYYFF